MNCLPKQIACSAGQACPSGWSCFDYSNLDGVPTGWTRDESGKACLPDGLVLAVEGHAAGGSAGGIGSSDSSGGDKGGTATVLRADAGLTGGSNAGSAIGLDAGTTLPPSETSPASGTDAGSAQPGPGATAAKPQGGGCALGGGHSTASNLWLALALAGLVVRVARRRPSGRQ
jgi:hypothetical protein